MNPSPNQLHRWVLVAAAFTIAGCSAQDAVPVLGSGASSQLTTVSIGDELDITLETIGPDAYDSLPNVSSPAVRFLDAAVVPPYSPGGPRQRFRFVAVQPGAAVVTFRHAGSDATVARAIEVR